MDYTNIMYDLNTIKLPLFNNGTDNGRHFQSSFIVYGAKSHYSMADYLEPKKFTIVLYDSKIDFDHIFFGFKYDFKIPVLQEPSLIDAKKIIDLLPAFPCNVIAIGGGSTIDLAKAIVCVRHFPDDVHIGYDKDRNLASSIEPAKDFLSVIPTTIGSGSEASRYFVLFQQERKIASRAWQAVPRLVVLDPDLLTYLTPVTARIQLFDCWTHLIEVNLSHLELSPIVLFQLDGIRQRLMNFVKSTKNLEDESTRLELQVFSYFGGVSISNTRTGALHTVGEALASQIAMPHVWSLYFSAIHWHQLIQGEERKDKNSVISQKTEILQTSLAELNYWLDYLKMELPRYLKLNHQEILSFDFQKFEKMVMLDKVLWDKEHPFEVSVKSIRNYLELTWNEVVKYGLEPTD